MKQSFSVYCRNTKPLMLRVNSNRWGNCIKLNLFYDVADTYRIVLWLAQSSDKRIFFDFSCQFVYLYQEIKTILLTCLNVRRRLITLFEVINKCYCWLRDNSVVVHLNIFLQYLAQYIGNICLFCATEIYVFFSLRKIVSHQTSHCQ